MQRHYIMQKIVLAIAVAAVIALVVLNLTWKEGPEPDAVFPMANQHIEYKGWER